MPSLRVLAVFCCLFLCAEPARAFAQEADNSVPNYLSVGGGWQELYRNTPYKNGGDFRLEHRWGMSLLSTASDSFRTVDSFFQLHPFAGLETTTGYQIYLFGGLVFDFSLGRHIVISPNFAAGYYSEGEGKHLGCPLEFRSTLEAGYRFDSEWRLTGYVGHTSNAHLGNKNPGVEHAGLYVHIPLKL